ncbi:MAG: histidine phosphatase family protein [Acidobacteria bacterium]|nr:histidine phosphatase family protein [Acidobacteriota bacterium]
MTEFLLIRHALTDAADRWYAGRMPGIDLNDRGRRDAATLARRLENITFDAIYSSPLERCLETAELIAKLQDVEVEVDHAFIEIDCGDWTGKPFGELRQDPSFGCFGTFRCGTRPPNGELLLEVQSRVVAAVLRLAERYPQKTIGIVSHSDPIKSVLAYFLGIPPDLASRLVTAPASISILDLEESDAKVKLINHTGPLGMLEL